jgi:hypothetical protein
VDKRFKNFTLNEKAACDHLARVEANLGFPLPTQYRHFMFDHDGGEGFIGSQYLILWQARELLEFNLEYDVKKYAPGLLLFGSNGGGEAFAFDTCDESMRIVMVPFIGMSIKDASPISDSFESFLSELADGTLG